MRMIDADALIEKFDEKVDMKGRMMTKKILDVTCGNRSIWFNKNHPAAIYADKRAE